jgi:hypothetical protein
MKIPWTSFTMTYEKRTRGLFVRSLSTALQLNGKSFHTKFGVNQTYSDHVMLCISLLIFWKLTKGNYSKFMKCSVLLLMHCTFSQWDPSSYEVSSPTFHDLGDNTGTIIKYQHLQRIITKKLGTCKVETVLSSSVYHSACRALIKYKILSTLSNYTKSNNF